MAGHVEHPQRHVAEADGVAGGEGLRGRRRRVHADAEQLALDDGVGQQRGVGGVHLPAAVLRLGEAPGEVGAAEHVVQVAVRQQQVADGQFGGLEVRLDGLAFGARRGAGVHDRRLAL